MRCALLLQKPLKYIIIGAAPISGDLLLELMIGQIVCLLQLQPGFSASDRMAGALAFLACCSTHMLSIQFQTGEGQKLESTSLRYGDSSC